jgi:hypothetical protein
MDPKSFVDTPGSDDVKQAIYGCTLKAPANLAFPLLLALLEDYEFSFRVRILDTSGLTTFNDADGENLVDKNLTYLTHLILKNCQITSSSFYSLLVAHWPIRSLDVERNNLGPLTSGVLNAIERKGSLTALSIGACGIDEQSRLAIAKNTRLTYPLDLSLLFFSVFFYIYYSFFINFSGSDPSSLLIFVSFCHQIFSLSLSLSLLPPLSLSLSSLPLSPSSFSSIFSSSL